METALRFPPAQPAMALGAGPMSAFSLPSPGLGQDTPRFIGERLSPAAVHIDNISSSSSQRSYSASSNYFNPIQDQQHQPQDSPRELPWIGTRQHSTTPTYASAATAATTIDDHTPTAVVESAHDKPQHLSHQSQHQVEQMSLTLNQQVSLGGPASLGHDSLVHIPPFGRQHQHQHDHDAQNNWNPSRSLYSAPTDPYGSSARNTPSPTTAHGTTEFGQQDSTTSTAAHFAAHMSNHHAGNGGGDGSGRSPLSQAQHPYTQHHQHQQQQQHHQQQQQPHHTHHDLSASALSSSLLPSGHGASSQSRHSTHDEGSTAGAAGNTHHSPDMMGYRSQHSPSMPSIPSMPSMPNMPSMPSMGGMPGISSSLSSKMGQTMSGLPGGSSFQMYAHQPLHQHQPHQPHQHTDHHQAHAQQQQHHHHHQTPSHHHTLPSPTHQGNHPLRLIPPPLPSQSGLASLGPPLGSPYASGGSSSRGGGYAAYQHQGVHQPSPHSPGGLAGPVISSLGSPSSHLSMVSGFGGMSYGSHGAGNSLGSAGLGSARRPLLYSQGQHHGALHAHLHPSQLGHHHLSDLMGGSKGGGMGSGMGGGMGGMSGPLSVHDRPFKCDQCPQSFNRNHDLKRHKRIHLAVKPFPCNYCDKSFSRKDALKRHRLVKGCGEKQPSSDRSSGHGGLPPASSVLSDATSDGGGNDLHSLR